MNNEKRFDVIVERVLLLDSVPSGSGIAVIDDTIFIIGDDATALYTFSFNDEKHQKIVLADTDTTVYRIEKPLKHDLECLAVAERDRRKYLLAFGSGSVVPQRDVLLVADADDPTKQQWISLNSLYSQLRKQVKTELNIEGAIVNNDRLYLLNRSGNNIFELKTTDLFNLVDAKGNYAISDIKIHHLDLPSNASISGGCMMDDRILFCASVEDTPNAYDDGEILGSFIGLADPEQEFRIPGFLPLQQGGRGLKDKLESIDVAGTYPNGDLKVVAVADNDDGSSKIYQLRVVYR